MKTFGIITMLLWFAVGSSGLWGGCSPSKANASEKHENDGDASVPMPAADRPVNVKVTTIVTEPITRNVVASGVTQSDRDITYSAEIGGRLDFMKLRPGAKVKKGQVLARIDFTSLSAQAQQAEASLELARLTHERLASLSAEKLVSQQKVDESRAGLLQAEASSKIAAVSLGKSIIRAQHNGVVAETYTDQGEFVAPGAPIARVVDTDDLIIEARFAESEISFVRGGSAATVRIEALGEDFAAKVDTVVPTADPESKTFKVRIRLDNNDERILVGMAARAKVSSDVESNAVLIPHDAVIEAGGIRRVFVSQGGVAQARPVTLGQSVDNRVAVLEGLAAGDQLVIVGQRELKDQQVITIVN